VRGKRISIRKFELVLNIFVVVPNSSHCSNFSLLQMRSDPSSSRTFASEYFSRTSAASVKKNTGLIYALQALKLRPISIKYLIFEVYMSDVIT
jgi:hypothetical protein